MCGRFSLVHGDDALRKLFDYDGPALNLPARYNIAPSQSVPLIKAGGVDRDGQTSPRAIAKMRWGLIPSWAKDPAIGHKLINARAETLTEKPSFRDSFRARRCLIPADGFYEWQGTGAGKQPYRLSMTEAAQTIETTDGTDATDDHPFAFAGLWDLWQGPEGPVRSFTIVTTAASAAIEHIHHRMPVIVSPAAYTPWLDPATPMADLNDMLHAPATDDAASKLAARPISPRVNNVAHDDPAVLAPAP